MPRVPNLVKPTSSPLLAPLTHVPRTSSRRLLIQPAMKPAQTVTASTSTLRTPSTSSRIQSRSFSTSQSLFSPKISGNEPQAQETKNEADNKEIQAISIEVEIIPPFYMTFWFRLTSFIFIGLAIFTLFHLRIRSINIKRRFLQKSNRDLAKEIKKRKKTENLHSKCNCTRSANHNL